MSIAIEQHFFSLIKLNLSLEKSLASASHQIEQDHLSELLLDLAWEKNRFTSQLRAELINLDGFSKDVLTLKKFSDFTEFEKDIVNTNKFDLKFLKNIISSTEVLFSNYEKVLAIHDLSVSSVILLKSQQDRIEHGLRLMQNYYNQNSNSDFLKTDLIA